MREHTHTWRKRKRRGGSGGSPPREGPHMCEIDLAAKRTWVVVRKGPFGALAASCVREDVDLAEKSRSK